MLLWNRPSSGESLATLVLAHGSGRPMDDPYFENFANLLAELKLTVVRFEFPYMADRRLKGTKRPPPRAESMVDDYLAICSTVLNESDGPILIGGKSMGGRIAMMVAGEPDLDERIVGVYCIGYPLHPLKKPTELRIDPLKNNRLPCLIVQGERDPFGTRVEFEQLELPKLIGIHWSTDGDHDLEPRAKAPTTGTENISTAVRTIRDFAKRVAAP